MRQQGPRLFIFGCGGYGREVMDMTLRHMAQLAANNIRVQAEFLVDQEGSIPPNRLVNGLTVRHIREVMGDKTRSMDGYVVAVGDPAARKKIVETIEKACIELGNPGRLQPDRVKSPTAVASDDSQAGPGSILSDFALISPNASIGTHFHANIYSYVAHDCVVGNYVTLAPKAAVNGNVRIGDGVYIGTGAVIKPGVSIGNGAVIGMGAMVLRDVEDGEIVVGNPAKPMNKKR